MNSEPPIMATHTRHSACQHSTGAPIKATMQVNPAMSDINEDLVHDDLLADAFRPIHLDANPA